MAVASLCRRLCVLLSLAGTWPILAAEVTAEQDHQAMMDQLGLHALRPGPSGDEKAPNHANYDEALANPFPDWPAIEAVSSDHWWQTRRPAILAAFEHDVLGRPPAPPPAVVWQAEPPEAAVIAGRPVSVTKATGHAGDGVDIGLRVILPSAAKRASPVLVMFTRQGQEDERVNSLIADGWGVAQLDPASVQPDTGAGLRHGIIGLVNRGNPRKPEDWGALRAWAWGASRAFDYLARQPGVDAAHIGIEGVSRYGKAALVAMAFDQRFAMVLAGSSGKGGATPYRRNFGEAVESLAGSGEYHWMAGNFLRYAAEGKSAADMMVDSPDLIALCAPRLVFISYGIPEKGDAKWLDQQGSFMAAVAAGEAWTVLGAKDLGLGHDYRHAVMPPVNQGLLDGQLAWRQDDGGHTDAPNMPSFVTWVDRQIGRASPRD